MIAVLVISAVVIIGVVAANSNGSNKPKTGSGTSLTTVGGVQTESGNTLHPPAADVRITGCSVDPTVQFASAELTITNHSSKSSNYMVQVGFFNSANVRLDDGYGIENNVPAGGSVDTTAQGLATIPAGTQITCKLVSVDRYASAG